MKIRSRWVTKCATFLAVALFRLLFATCRKVQVVSDPRLRVDGAPDDADPERFIVCVWHDSLLIPAFCGSRSLALRSSCLTSRHFDGSYIAETMQRLGLRAIRGSTSHGGAEAIRQLMDEAADRHVIITPDGPRGPRRQMKPGAVFLASETGRRLVVTAFVCSRGWRPRGKWTDLLIPRPFSTIYIVAAPPMAIPPDLSRSDLERTVQDVQRAMDELNAVAERMVNPPIVPAHEPEQRAAA